MKPRNTAYALLAILAALIWGAKDHITYEWEGVADEWKMVWVVALIAIGSGILIWFLYPYMGNLI